MLSLFYEEPAEDRWLPLDRYPRAWIRRVLRGKERPGGQKRVFLNLCAGLTRIRVAFRVNDYSRARKNPGELACIVGKPFVLDKVRWANPILFGASVFSHPLNDPDLIRRLPVRRVLVPGEWMRKMWEPYYGDRVWAWPVGIDTDLWRPSADAVKDVDVLLYDKIRWEHGEYEVPLLAPIREGLARRGLQVAEIRYGYYEEDDFRDLLSRSRAMLFLCEHETQGIAYQQALSAGVPILAWERGGEWCDPEFYPHRVRFGPVSAVPYWDERCGRKFIGVADFERALDDFLHALRSRAFRPRDYIMENLTLEQSARRYVEHADAVRGG